MPDTDTTQSLIGLTVQIVSAHVKNNQVAAASLPALIQQVYAALANVDAPAHRPATVEKPAPAIAVKKSVFQDYIICLEDGRRMKTLKRHLRATYDLSPEQYREKWGLPPDYPMVAPSYAARRSSLAKQLGLGRRIAETETAATQLQAIEKEKPLEQMPARPWQVVSAPTPAAAAPAHERRPEPTLDSVFRSFPKAPTDEAESQTENDDTSNDPRRATRKPFSKQLARSMRR